MGFIAYCSEDRLQTLTLPVCFKNNMVLCYSGIASVQIQKICKSNKIKSYEWLLLPLGNISVVKDDTARELKSH